MATIECNAQQLRLIQDALDCYSRLNIGQFSIIKDLPTFENHLSEFCRPKKEPEVGNRTNQGEILEIKGKKALISGSVAKNGHWVNKQKWIPLKDVKLSTDYSLYHSIRDQVDDILAQARNHLIQDYSVGKNGSWGIYNQNVDESARDAFGMVQVIRHELWKVNPNRSEHTVDSSVDSFIKNKIKVTL